MSQEHDPYLALKSRDYRRYAAGNVVSSLGLQMLDVAIGWELYERTGSAMALGLVGLFLIAPVLLFTLPAGHLADRVDRRGIVVISQALRAVIALWLAWLSYSHGPVADIYVALVLFGGVGAFSTPASRSLLPQIVPEEVFANAVTWNSSLWQTAAVAGPALGGLIIGITKSAVPVYVTVAVTSLIFVPVLASLNPRYAKRSLEPISLESFVAGIKFVKDTKIILAAFTLDMFAVLLGGAVTLLPIYAKDILHVGPGGLGWLRAAPSAGALLMALSLTHLPPMKHAGKTLLYCVAGFGAATIVFGVSRNFMLSMAALFLTGAFDMVSVVVRQTLVQLRTPDQLRGRVSAVTSIFIGTSNELGGFESGTVAHLLGTMHSVVLGGVGTILVVLGVGALWPEVRKLGPLRAPAEPEAETDLEGSNA